MKIIRHGEKYTVKITERSKINRKKKEKESRNKKRGLSTQNT